MKNSLIVNRSSRKTFGTAKPRKTKAQCRAIAEELRKTMYDVLVDEGICGRCGSAPADVGNVLCGDCKLYWREHKKASLHHGD